LARRQQVGILIPLPGQFTCCSRPFEIMAPMKEQRRSSRPNPGLILACILGIAGLIGGGVGVFNLVSANQLNAETSLIEVSP
jgi:hypothetical protein